MLKYRVEQKTLAKFSDTCYVRADGLCIGCPRLVGSRKAANSNMLEFFAPRCRGPQYCYYRCIGYFGNGDVAVLIVPLGHALITALSGVGRQTLIFGHSHDVSKDAGYDVGASFLCFMAQILFKSIGMKYHWEIHIKFFSDENMKVPRVRIEL